MDFTHSAQHLAHLGNDIGNFVKQINPIMSRALNVSGKKQVEFIKEEMIGHTHPDWPALEASTEERKDRGGYSGGPLERTEALKESYDYQVIEEPDGPSLMVGSTSPVAVDHEFGTIHHPPRPVLTPTAQRFEDEVAEIMGEDIAAALIRANDMALIRIPGIGTGDIFEGPRSAAPLDASASAPKKPIN